MIVICFSALVILYKRCFSNIAKHNNRKTVRAKKIDYDKNIKKINKSGLCLTRYGYHLKKNRI